MKHKLESAIRNLFKMVLFLVFFSISAGHLYAQNNQTVPPGGSILLVLPGQNGGEVKIKSFETPNQGKAYFIEGKKRLVYHAPSDIDELTSVSIAYNLSGEDAPRSFELKIDPFYSAQTNSVVSTAMEWLFVLLVLALFIEAAVLVLVALIRNFIRLFKGVEGLNENGPKPSIYKPTFALILSALAVLGFGLNPIDAIVSAFGGDGSYNVGAWVTNTADAGITILLLAGGAESVRRVATGVVAGLVPSAGEVDDAAIRADTR